MQKFFKFLMEKYAVKMQICKYETQKSIKEFNANSYLQKFIS